MAPATVVTQKPAPAAPMPQRPALGATGQRLYKPLLANTAADATAPRANSYSRPQTYNYSKPINSTSVQPNGAAPATNGVSQTGAASGYFLPPN
ncbi:MAG: hypothetical protein ACJ8F7_16735 [Gemmataceae bacterium]